MYGSINVMEIFHEGCCPNMLLLVYLELLFYPDITMSLIYTSNCYLNCFTCNVISLFWKFGKFRGRVVKIMMKLCQSHSILSLVQIYGHKTVLDAFFFFLSKFFKKRKYLKFGILMYHCCHMWRKCFIKLFVKV